MMDNTTLYKQSSSFNISPCSRLEDFLELVTRSNVTIQTTLSSSVNEVSAVCTFLFWSILYVTQSKHMGQLTFLH